MHRLDISVELDDEMYRSLEGEAKRAGVKLQSLVEQMVQGLLLELEEQEKEDQPILPE